MPSRLILAVVGVLLALPPPAAAEERGAGAAAEPSATAPRGKVLTWEIPGKDAEKQYAAFRIPPKYDPAVGATLIVMMHGTNLDYRWSFAMFDPKTFRPQDILVSLDGSRPNGKGAFNFMYDSKPDLDYVVAIIDRFKRAFRINRVYLYGHSQGGIVAHTLLGEHPELIDGIVSNAGNVVIAKTPSAAKSKPVAIVHDRHDPLMPFEECAERSLQFYQKNKYEYVRLFPTDMTVEYKNPDAGHLPNPEKTAEALSWIDAHSLRGPAELIQLARRMTEEAKPDSRKVLDVLTEAREALGRRGVSSDVKKKAEADLAELMAPIDRRVTAHTERLQALAGEKWKDLPYGPWAEYAVLLRSRYRGSIALAEFEKRTYGPVVKSQTSKARGLSVELKQAVQLKRWAQADKRAAELLKDGFLVLEELELGETLAALDGAGKGEAARKIRDERAPASAEARKIFNEVEGTLNGAPAESSPEAPEKSPENQ